MTPARDVGNGTPWWVRAMATYGVGTAIGAYLLWWVTTTVAAGITGVSQHIADHEDRTSRQVQDIASQVRAATAVIEGRDQRLERLLRQICVNTADTRVDRDACFPGTR